jgi:hypothetical protein
MEAFAALWWIFVLGFVLITPLTLFLPFYVAAKMRGMERAQWAMVSQLRAMRMEKHTDVDPAATRRALEVADSPGHVKFSRFGR